MKRDEDGARRGRKIEKNGEEGRMKSGGWAVPQNKEWRRTRNEADRGMKTE